MKVMIQAPIGEEAGLAEIDVSPQHTIRDVKREVCKAFGIAGSTVALMYGGEVLDENKTIQELGITENSQMAIMPLDIVGGLWN
ncbi:MAG: hypothetical protein JSW28_03650 [Thermoplasmata archaeon]|nr:MAG: hypothetical protein JSW28_03650 [Thermoplasmata archaeon]